MENWSVGARIIAGWYQILISCKNMIIHLYDIVILDFFVIFCLSMLKCTYD